MTPIYFRRYLKMQSEKKKQVSVRQCHLHPNKTKSCRKQDFNWHLSDSGPLLSYLPFRKRLKDQQEPSRNVFALLTIINICRYTQCLDLCEKKNILLLSHTLGTLLYLQMLKHYLRRESRTFLQEPTLPRSAAETLYPGYSKRRI